MKLKIVFLIFIFTLVASPQVTVKVKLSGGSTLQKVMEKRITAVINSFNNAFGNGSIPEIINENVTIDAKEGIMKLWQSAPFYCTEPSLKLKVLNLAKSEDFEVRNIPLNFKEGTNIRKYECILHLNKDGVVSDMLMGMESQRYDSLLNFGSDVTDLRRRFLILNFLEIYRTAYNKRDIDFIESVFSDEAVIIKGVVTFDKSTYSDEISSSSGKFNVKYEKMKKQEYVSELRAAFKRLSYLKVDFNDYKIIKHTSKDYLYGVSLRQNWAQDGYKDVGYLFLLIDFRDETHPVIHVRAWQPDNFIKEKDLFDVGDFDVL